jgi:diguanylate cyclase (GGDEF)-like protein
MVSERRLSAVLSEFARTMVTDFPIQAILDRLVERIVEVLPVSAAGVSLIEAGTAPHYVAASNAGALQLEKLQTALGHGPCLTAYTTGHPVSIPDLHATSEFPEFAAIASSTGLVAAFALPLRHDDERLGALDLFRDTPGPLSAADLAAAQTLADVTTAYLLNARARERALAVAERFRERALYDGLTGLANRALLQQRLEHAAERARRTHADAAVLFADLDGFKQVNDTHGHAVGDALLVAVAHRLRALLRPGDTLARVSGDEFVILCEDLAAATDVEALAQRVDEAFTRPFDLAPGGPDVPLVKGKPGCAVQPVQPVPHEPADRLQVSVTASVGMAYAGRAEDIGLSLVRDADTAMYQAKRKGGAAHQVIDLREAERTAERLQLASDLRAAFAAERLHVVYQPIVRVADGSVSGVEALLRWTHPQHGPVNPLTVVSIAEESSLILDLGAWVLRTACTDHRRLASTQVGRALDMAVNVSPRQLVDHRYPAQVAAVLAETGTDPACLILEMTEGIFLDDPGRTGAVLEELKSLGVRLALDDFGTGYSSLSYLRQFPVDIVKIDQAFVADIGQHPSGSAIVGAVTHLSHVLGMTVTAEGVETSAQHDEVRSIGSEHAQGYYYSRPQTIDRLSGRLSWHEGRAAQDRRAV